MDKAPLIATAEPKVRKVGSVNPPLTVSYSGFVNGEDERVLDTPPTTSTAADANSPAGTYAITIGGGSDDSYAFTYVNSTLTVSSKDVPEIAWVPEPITYGVPLGPAQLNATASFGGHSVDGTFSYATTAGTVLDAGAHTLQVVFNPSDSATYAAAPTSAQLIVAKAPLTRRRRLAAADLRRHQRGADIHGRRVSQWRHGSQRAERQLGQQATATARLAAMTSLRARSLPQTTLSRLSLAR